MVDSPCHTLSIDEIIKNLDANINTGLSHSEAEDRLKKYGHNQLEEKEGVSPLMLFLSQFNDFIVWVLIAAAIVSGFMGEWVDALAILAIVIINAIIGFIQEFRAEKSLAALQKMPQWEETSPIRANLFLLFFYQVGIVLLLFMRIPISNIASPCPPPRGGERGRMNVEG